MTDTIRALIARLPADPWRDDEGFSADVTEAARRLVESNSEEQQGRALGDWLQRHQPCLFGRAAAALGLMHYCILSPSDLEETDERIRDKIQAERRAWHRAAFEGQKSGFVILALSERIASGRPGDVTRRLAQRLCSLYLLTEVQMDSIYLDDLHLELPGPARATLQWRVGVNYFCAQGDRRWWQDHRIPGGMALSMNSVGHLVKSRALAEGMAELEKRLGQVTGDWVQSKIESPGQALVFAMRTIDLAADAVSGKATELVALPDDSSALPRCPVELPKDLVGKNHCEYAGYYHTDITLPSEYFQPDVERPGTATRRSLDFTYLFSPATSNLDHFTMGVGIPIRQLDASEPSPFGDRTLKALKSVGSELSPADADKLVARLYGC